MAGALARDARALRVRRSLRRRSSTSPAGRRRAPGGHDEQLQDAVTFAMAASGASGAIVGVWAPWSGSWVTGLGTQNVGGGADVTHGRCSSAPRRRPAPMTCDVLYALEAKGTVSGDDSVTEYVAGVSDLDDITLDQLCDGTSGIGSYAPALLSQWLIEPRPRVGPPRARQLRARPGAHRAGRRLHRLGRRLPAARARARARIGADARASCSTSTCSEPLELDATTLPRMPRRSPPATLRRSPGTTP